MSNPASISGVDLTTQQGRQILQDALDILYGLIQKAGGTAAGPTTFDELRVRMLTVLGTIDVVPEDKPPANVNSRLVTPWLTGQRGRGQVWRFEDQQDGGNLLEVRSQPYLIGTPSATAGDWEFRFYSAQRDPAGAYRTLGAIRMGSDGRIRTYDATEVVTFDSSTAVASSAVPLPPRHVSGLLIRYASTSTITVSAGKARDKADGADMTLSAEVTVDLTTANAALGGERKTLTGTATFTNLSTAVTGSGTAFLTEFGVRSGTGTITAAASSTLTGTGTKFLTEVAVNDLIGTSAAGYSRVSAIASDTSLTMDNPLTVTAQTPGIVENPKIETAGGRTYMVSLISSNTSLALVSSTGATATENTVAAYAGSKKCTTATANDGWRAVWLLSGGSGTTVAFSTQRTTPYLSITGYTTSYRRIGWVRVDASGNVLPTYGGDGGSQRRVDYEATATDCLMLNNGASTTSWVDILCASVVPPTSRMIHVNVAQYFADTNYILHFRGRGLGGSTVGRPRTCVQHAAGTGIVFTGFGIPCDGAQVLQHGATGSTADGTYCYVTGYEDVLE